MRHTVFGLDSHSDVKFGQVVSVIARPQIPCRPIWLAIPEHIAKSFIIHGIRVGNNYQTATAESIPAECFSTKGDILAVINTSLKDAKIRTDGGYTEIITVEDCQIAVDFKMPAEKFLGEFRMEPLGPGMDFFLNVENSGGNHGNPTRFMAAIFAEVLDIENWRGLR